MFVGLARVYKYEWRHFRHILGTWTDDPVICTARQRSLFSISLVTMQYHVYLKIALVHLHLSTTSTFYILPFAGDKS